MSKIASISSSSLTPIYFDDSYKYIIRYRISASNRNRFSEWSPFYDIDVPPASEILRGQTVTPSASVQLLPESEPLVLIYWDLPSNISNFENFDIFVRWFTPNAATPGDPDDGTWTDWEYLNTQPPGPISILRRLSSFSDLQVSVQLPSFPKIPIILGLDDSASILNNQILNKYLQIFEVDVSL